MLDSELLASIRLLVEQETGRSIQWGPTRTVGGGCINNTAILETDIGLSLFVKWNEQAPASLFQCESAGLEAIRSTRSLRVPEVIGSGVSARGVQFLVLEAIQTAAPGADFEQPLGRQLAELHRHGVAEEFGFTHSNFIGSTPQPNRWNSSWIEFWKSCRLGHQLNLARDNGYGDQRFSRLAERVLGRMDRLLSHEVQPALIHGDLWSGNYLADEQGNPVLLDPAVYFADREAEFGMTTLFGGLGQGFYDAYQEMWPLQAGSDDRIEIYRLYHLLNHLNLFGTSYLADCLQIMQKYA